MTDDKMLWMLGEVASDEMNLTESDLYALLNVPGSVIGYSDAEVDYVSLLEQEWLSKRGVFHLPGPA